MIKQRMWIKMQGWILFEHNTKNVSYEKWEGEYSQKEVTFSKF